MWSFSFVPKSCPTAEAFKPVLQMSLSVPFQAKGAEIVHCLHSLFAFLNVLHLCGLGKETEFSSLLKKPLGEVLLSHLKFVGTHLRFVLAKRT